MYRFHQPVSPRILTLATAISTTVYALSSPVIAQEDDVYELITTAIHVRSSETALPITVLDDEALHDAVRSTLGDTLAGQPGINNASFGPAVGQTVIRGQQGRRVMNLTNGLPIADASGNSADHAQTVEAILARAIEVLRGPSTLLYGGGAIGGVVNVIDRRIAEELPAKPAFAFETRHDTAADLSTAVGSADFATGNLVWHFDALQREWNNLDIPGPAIDPAWLAAEEHNEHDGHELETPQEERPVSIYGSIPNTGGKTTSAVAGVSAIFDSGFLGLAVSKLDNRYGLPPGAHAHEDEHDEEHHDAAADHDEGEDNVRIDMNSTRYDLGGEWRDLAPGIEKLAYRASYTDYEHAELEGPGIVGTHFSNASVQHRLQLTHMETAGWHGVLGLQHGDEEFAARGEESFIPVSDIASTGVFIVEDYHAGSVTYELGARLNHDDYSPQQTAVPGRDFSTSSFSASALWDAHPALTLGLSVAHAERAPSVEELYSNFGLAAIDSCVIHFATGACELGNVDFGEETSLNTDFTVYVDYGIAQATVSLFYNDFRNYIGQSTTDREVDGFPVREYQQIDAVFSGIEVDMNVELSELLNLRLFGDAIRGRFDNHTDVPRMPPNRVGMELKIGRDEWSAYARLLRASSQNKPGAFELATDAWTRIDIGADWRFDIGNGRELMLFINGRNLGNEEIRLSSSYLRGFAPEAGRSVETGVRLRF